MPYTTYLNTKLNKLAFGKTAYTGDTTHYIALSTTTPTQAGTNFTEPSGNGYARVSVTNNTTNWVPSSSQPGDGSQQQENGTTIQFPDATGSWGTITYFGIYDASTSGNLLAYGALDASKTITTEDSASFAAGALKIKLD